MAVPHSAATAPGAEQTDAALSVLGWPQTMKALPIEWTAAVIIYGVLVLLVGCAGIIVTPESKPPLTVLWDTEILTNRLELEWWSPELIPLQSFEFGRRSDGVVVWRTNALAANVTEATRLWREYQNKALLQHEIDRGEKWKVGPE